MAIPPTSFGHISLILDVSFFLKSSPRFVNSFSINEALNSGLAVSATRNPEYTQSYKYIACREAVVKFMLDFRSPSHWKPEKRSTA